ncbi:hypothetical protein PR202_gb19469 [Eleusine coracana subsp. coracana]|uniref:Uncharacterized protein n=1 Tax=Eleusine coracana subsp. coracana TaxID=191504 RepID=A0AAV5FA33_ELECO|nr:hypothetical protein PR202_gb19469 [Eleusine coracana subsp. coracana]
MGCGAAADGDFACSCSLPVRDSEFRVSCLSERRKIGATQNFLAPGGPLPPPAPCLHLLQSHSPLRRSTAMALAMTSSSPQPPPHSHRRRRRSHPAASSPNTKSKPRAKALPLLSDVGVGRDPAAIKYYARVASNLAAAGRLRDFLLAAEGLRAAAGDDPGFAARISARLLSRGVVAALRDCGLQYVLDFFRDAERVGVPAAGMLDSEASDAIGAACRVLLDERRMAQFVEVVEALARNVASNLLVFMCLQSVDAVVH